MASKPKPGSKQRRVRAQDGARKGGGINTSMHAGPKRKSKTAARGLKGSQLQRRLEP